MIKRLMLFWFVTASIGAMVVNWAWPQECEERFSTVTIRAEPKSLAHARELCSKYGRGISSMMVQFSTPRGMTVTVPCMEVSR